MTPKSWKYLIIFSFALAYVVQADPYRLSFLNGIAVPTSEAAQNDVPDEEPARAPNFATHSSHADAENVQTPTKTEPDLIKNATNLPSEDLEDDAYIQDILKNDTDSHALGLWLTSTKTSQDVADMVEHRSGVLEALPEDIRTYFLGYSGNFGYYAIDDSGLMIHLESPTRPKASSCLQWMWTRFWKRAYVLAGMKLEDMPESILQRIRDNPRQTTFNVGRGVVFFQPGALYGPVLYWLGWTSLGVAAGSFAASLQGALIPAGGWFATLTSAAMGGHGAGVLGWLGPGIVGLGNIWSLGHEFWKCYSNTTM